MSTTQSILAERIFAALRSAPVADQAGIATATWASTTIPRVFQGFSGYLAGRNRGRLPFIEFEFQSQGFAHETFEGGTVSTVVTLRAHCGGRDLETAGNLLNAMIASSLAELRSEAADNYTAFGSDQITVIQQGPWGHFIECQTNFEHTFARSDYEVGP